MIILHTYFLAKVLFCKILLLILNQQINIVNIYYV